MSTCGSRSAGNAGAGGEGALAEHILRFARVLRAAGVRVGSDTVLRAVEVVLTVGLRRRDDFYWALHAVFVRHRRERALFDEVFHVYWRDPEWMRKMMGMILPSPSMAEPMQGRELSRRVREALQREGTSHVRESMDERLNSIEIDASLTFSEREILQSKDFEQMSAEEIDDARRAIAALRWQLAPILTRRYRRDARGNRLDPRRTMRQAARCADDGVLLFWRARRWRAPALVVLVDISGSMQCYARMFLLFLHMLVHRYERVHSFVFATRLSCITQAMRLADADEALGRAGALVPDWSGGTRIGACLSEFRRTQARRLLSQGASVILVTDGLDRDSGGGLEDALRGIRRSSRRLIWLNPLLRYDGYGPEAVGARTIVRYSDEVRSIHNVDSLRSLAASLGGKAAGLEGDRLPALRAAGAFP